jgi:hypothetical protein
MEKFILDPITITEMQKKILSQNSTQSWEKIIEKLLIDIYAK